MWLIGDSNVAGLSRYQAVWKKYYFKTYKALNCGIFRDRTQNFLWRAEDLPLPLSVKYLVVHCGTNNLDHNKPKAMVDDSIILKVFKSPRKIDSRS